MTRRRIPADEKRAKGTYRADREARTPPARVAGIPETPRGLKGLALQHWRQMLELLSRRAQLTADCGPALECLCQTFAERRAFAEMLERHGHVQSVRTTTGEVVSRAHPAARMYRDADRRYRAWLVEFGLTDASRGRVNAVSLARYGLDFS